MDYPLLSKINNPKDVKQLSSDQLPSLAKELRQFIIEVVAAHEGHLGASLGVVELTIALHYVFNTPHDILIWDVGHQAYGHKILTGRKDIFHTNRKLHGISGFPKIKESVYDAFGTGHSSTSISALLGMAIAARIQGKKRKHIAVIGDASIAAGMAFEALNHAGDCNPDMIIILNDNSIAIDPSVGALKSYLTKVKSQSKDTYEKNIFEALNFEYHGPYEGHDLILLIQKLQELHKKKGPQFLHISTLKGKGLKPAEENQVVYHAPGKFNAKTGALIKKEEKNKFTKFQDVFGYTLLELAEKNENIVGITPAMPSGSSLKYMMDKFPNRAFDVGIAEQHAITFAAGLAQSGLTVYCTIYSTFLQRGYDQLIHDVALQNIPVVFCIDRAGLVGRDGPTHHGVFDISFLRCIPNLIIAAPSNELELRDLLYTAQLDPQKPMAIRYPRGYGKIAHWRKPFKRIRMGKGYEVQKGKDIALLCIGTTVDIAFRASNSHETSIYDMRFVKPLDKELLKKIFKEYKRVITLENGVTKGGFGSAVLEFANTINHSTKIHTLGLPDQFIEQGSVDELLKDTDLNTEKIQKLIEDFKGPQ